MHKEQDRAFLASVAREAMIDRGLEPDFPDAAIRQADQLSEPVITAHAVKSGAISLEPRDLRELLWCSIDNDDSRDLDQLSVAEAMPDGSTRLLVAIADVSAAVPLGSAIDEHAATNTTSVYTPPEIFPMLPERLSTDLTSLNEAEDRAAMVIELVVDANGVVGESSVYTAFVRNKAKLAYRSVGAWLEGVGPAPDDVERQPALAENLKLQDAAASRLKEHRHAQGALELETIEPRARFEGDRVASLAAEARTRAHELIEDVMIAANGVVARFLTSRDFPVIRRMVREPKRWPRIVDLAQELGETLPGEPDAKALHTFLLKRRAADPLRFPDLSIAVVKLLGKGEYEASVPGEAVDGHFGLALSDYTHSTAPNRRYPDLITQRLVKAALANAPVPYSNEELHRLAAHCTAKEDDAQKVERLMRKAAAACLLSSHIGEEFDGLITGASSKGTWVRIFDPPAEGRVEQGAEGLDVGDEVRVRLTATDPRRGFIDFARAGRPERRSRIAR